MKKTAISLLLAGDPIILIDNVIGVMPSEPLATILTESSYSGRILGLSKMSGHLPTNCLWLASGNNLRFSGDLPSRTIVSRIDARMENPEERSGFKIPNLRQWIRENRARYIQAGLTVLKGYHNAGRPKQSLKQFGRFEQWSEQIRSALVWAGFDDPYTTRKRIVDSDPERSSTSAVFNLWHEEFKDEREVDLALIATKAMSNKPLLHALLAIAAVYNRPDDFDPKRFGNWCRDRNGRVVDGLVLVRGRLNQHTKTYSWRVVKETSDKRHSYTVQETLDGLGKPKGPDPEPDEFEPPELESPDTAEPPESDNEVDVPYEEDPEEEI